MANSSPRKQAPFQILLYGSVQLLLALISANWMWMLWDRAETEVPAAFWGALALTLFLLGGAQINLIGPLREVRGRPPVPRLTLPYRLKPQFGEALTVWTMFSLAFTFGAPVLPLILLWLKAEGNLAELSLIWAGLALCGALIGGATFWLGLQRLYERLNGSETVVETSAETVKPGESLSVFVQFTPGKLAVARLRVKLVCQETRTPRNNRSGKVAETKVLYEQEVESILRPEAVWHRSFSVTLPETDFLSLDSQRYAMTWGFEVTAEMPGAPDVKELFVFTVDDPDLRARWEAEWEAEDAQ